MNVWGSDAVHLLWPSLWRRPLPEAALLIEIFEQLLVHLLHPQQLPALLLHLPPEELPAPAGGLLLEQPPCFSIALGLCVQVQDYMTR